MKLSGAWQLNAGVPSPSLVDQELQSAAEVRTVRFDTSGLLSWDSTILAFLVHVFEVCRRRRINVDRQGLPAGLCQLLDLAEAVPEKKGNNVPRAGWKFRHWRRLLSGRDAQIHWRDESYLHSALAHERTLPLV